jgi:heme/copper-type cytochrome/quinol oxidase subunit 3
VDVQFATSKYTEDNAAAPDLALKNKRLALLLWRIANGLIFLFFIFANYLMRSVQTSWPPEGAARPDMLIPAVVSILLLLSSIPATRALNAIRRGDRVGMQRNIVLVLAVGALLLAVQRAV